jgi:hypothetical protein
LALMNGPLAPFRAGAVGRAVLCLLAFLALAAALGACGGGTETVTVTVTAGQTPPPAEGSEGGDKVEPSGGPVAGYVDNLKSEGEDIVLQGWAASGDFAEPASKVAAEVGGKVVAEAVPSIVRKDVVEAIGQPGVEKSGFELQVPSGDLECGSPAAGVKVKAESAGKSGTLPYGEGMKEAVEEAC